MRRTLFVLLAALALPALAGQPATLSRPAELRSTPYGAGTTLKTLPTGAKVDVIKRVGGWYQVKADASEGWVRMWLVRFASTAGSGGGVAILGSGRSSSTYTTATTGVRGLSEEELKNAQPNPQAVAALDALAVTPDDARRFAQQAPLKANPAVKEAP